MRDLPDPGLLHRPLSDVLAALASQHDLAGGGGPAAALAAAAAAAVTAKVARGSRATWIEAGGAIAHAESLRMQAQALIDRDVGAYRQAQAVLLESERSARVGVAGPALSADPSAAADRERRAGEVLAHAADLSLAIADAASEIAQLAARVARCCPSSLRPDALAAVALAEAAASGAAALVEANRRLPPDDRRRAASCAAAEAASRAREQGG
ncbi:MAG: cyclodeaminase/cyclohydrolase family protein [Thermoleophilia bacterium]